MKIVACMKQVPDKETRFELNATGAWIREQDLTFEINECDAHALEEALRLKEKHNGEVVLLSIGSESAEKTLRRGLALGADRAILVTAERPQGTDPLTTARVLREQIRSEQPDLVLTGVRSDDNAFSQTGVMVAELLGWPHATIVMSVETEGDGTRLRIRRELEAGLLEEVALPLPAVLTIQQGINQIRYASLKGIMAAKKKELRRTQWDPAAAGAVKIRIEKVGFPRSDKKSEILLGSPAEAAASLVERMKSEIRIL